MSPVKSKIDGVTKNIYSNLQDSYKEAAAKESKYKGEGTADFYKSQHIMVPPPQIMSTEQGHTRKRSTLVPKLGQDRNDGTFVEGLSSSNRILLNKGLKPGMLPALAQTGRTRMSGIP